MYNITCGIQRQINAT